MTLRVTAMPAVYNPRTATQPCHWGDPKLVIAGRKRRLNLYLGKQQIQCRHACWTQIRSLARTTRAMTTALSRNWCNLQVNSGGLNTTLNFGCSQEHAGPWWDLKKTINQIYFAISLAYWQAPKLAWWDDWQSNKHVAHPHKAAVLPTALGGGLEGRHLPSAVPPHYMPLPWWWWQWWQSRAYCT